jgi:hypothetical protein
MVSEQFRKKKVDAAAIWRKTQLSKRTNGARSRATEAEKIVQEGLERFGLSESNLKSSPGSDPEKGGNCRLHSPKHDNPAKLDGGTPADEKRSQCQSTT